VSTKGGNATKKEAGQIKRIFCPAGRISGERAQSQEKQCEAKEWISQWHN
jgi:hypothetical protein